MSRQHTGVGRRIGEQIVFQFHSLFPIQNLYSKFIWVLSEQSGDISCSPLYIFIFVLCCFDIFNLSQGNRGYYKRLLKSCFLHIEQSASVIKFHTKSSYKISSTNPYLSMVLASIYHCFRSIALYSFSVILVL